MSRGGIGAAVRTNHDRPLPRRDVHFTLENNDWNCAFECEMHVSASGGARRGRRPPCGAPLRDPRQRRLSKSATKTPIEPGRRKRIVDIPRFFSPPIPVRSAFVADLDTPPPRLATGAPPAPRRHLQNDLPTFPPIGGPGRTVRPRASGAPRALWGVWRARGIRGRSVRPELSTGCALSAGLVCRFRRFRVSFPPVSAKGRWVSGPTRTPASATHSAPRRAPRPRCPGRGPPRPGRRARPPEPPTARAPA